MKKLKCKLPEANIPDTLNKAKKGIKIPIKVKGRKK
jgi:hypothetical protein